MLLLLVKFEGIAMQNGKALDVFVCRTVPRADGVIGMRRDLACRGLCVRGKMRDQKMSR